MIKIENLSYKYPNGATAIKDINISFSGGAISAILGESGSGKTTLLKCLGRFLEPQTGVIKFDGTDIQQMSSAEFRQAIGIVFQKLYLFPHLTVLENMTLALRKVYGQTRHHAKIQAMEMLERLGINELVQNYPSEISGGQAQRVAIARGLVLHPAFMLLDEPTSALDANTTDDFAKWLLELNEQTAEKSTNFIIVTHDILFARKAATHGIYLSSGKVLDINNVDTIIQHVQAGQLIESNKNG